MPSEKGVVWRIRMSNDHEISKEETLQDSSDDDSEQQEVIYKDLAEEQEEGFGAAGQGMTLDELIAEVGDCQEKEEEKADENEKVAEKPRRRRARAFADASEDDDHAGKKGKKKAAEGAAAKAKAKVPMRRTPAQPAPRTPAQPAARPAAAPAVSAGNGSPQAEAESGGGSLAASAASADAAAAPKPKGGPGRTGAPIPTVVLNQLSMFKVATAESSFLGEAAETSIKSIRRYIGVAATKLATLSDEKEIEEYEQHKKHLQMIETCIKLWKSWHNKKDLPRGLRMFNQQWSALDLFITSEPPVAMECRTIWELFLKVRSYEPEQLALALQSPRLTSIEPDVSKHFALADEYIGYMIVNVFGADGNSADVAGELADALKLFIDDRTKYNSALIDAIIDVRTFIAPPAAPGPAASALLQSMMRTTGKDHVGSSHEMVKALQQSPKHLAYVHQQVQNIFDRAGKTATVVDQLTSFIKDLSVKDTAWQELLQVLVGAVKWSTENVTEDTVVQLKTASSNVFDEFKAALAECVSFVVVGFIKGWALHFSSLNALSPDEVHWSIRNFLKACEAVTWCLMPYASWSYADRCYFPSSLPLILLWSMSYAICPVPQGVSGQGLWAWDMFFWSGRWGHSPFAMSERLAGRPLGTRVFGAWELSTDWEQRLPGSGCTTEARRRRGCGQAMRVCLVLEYLGVGVGPLGGARPCTRSALLHSAVVPRRGQWCDDEVVEDPVRPCFDRRGRGDRSAEARPSRERPLVPGEEAQHRVRGHFCGGILHPCARAAVERDLGRACWRAGG